MAHHETILKTVDIGTGPIKQIPTIPSLLKKNKNGTVNLVTDGKPRVGDTYLIFPSPKTYEITDVIETRPARGDWSGKSYEGLQPIFSIVRSQIKAS